MSPIETTMSFLVVSQFFYEIWYSRRITNVKSVWGLDNLERYLLFNNVILENRISHTMYMELNAVANFISNFLQTE